MHADKENATATCFFRVGERIVYTTDSVDPSLSTVGAVRREGTKGRAESNSDKDVDSGMDVGKQVQRWVSRGLRMKACERERERA